MAEPADPAELALVHKAICLGQVEERRNEYRDRQRFYYRAVISVPELRRGLFVEIVLVDDDPESPSVEIVNAHEAGR